MSPLGLEVLCYRLYVILHNLLYDTRLHRVSFVLQTIVILHNLLYDTRLQKRDTKDFKLWDDTVALTVRPQPPILK